MQPGHRPLFQMCIRDRILDGHQKPIILLPKKAGGRLCESVAPDNPKIGVMLPYAPIQLLLFDYQDDVEVSDCLVMTSANTSGADVYKRQVSRCDRTGNEGRAD